MSDATDVGVGLVGGAVLTGALEAAGEDAGAALLIGGGAGLVLALTPRARAGGIALLLASVVGAAVLTLRKPARRRRKRAHAG
jgi:hypothetical protein